MQVGGLNNLQFNHIIVDKTTGWETQRIPKGAYKAVLFCVEQTVTVHVVFPLVSLSVSTG